MTIEQIYAGCLAQGLELPWLQAILSLAPRKRCCPEQVWNAFLYSAKY
jgi:hypothetical protein